MGRCGWGHELLPGRAPPQIVVLAGEEPLEGLGLDIGIVVIEGLEPER
jgi:hypothetical protein